MAKTIDSALMAAFKHFTVGWCLLFKQFLVNDQSIGLLGKKQCVAEFDLCTSLVANYNMNVLFIKAQCFIPVVNPTFADDSFMGLFDNRS